MCCGLYVAIEFGLYLTSLRSLRDANLQMHANVANKTVRHIVSEDSQNLFFF